MWTYSLHARKNHSNNSSDYVIWSNHNFSHDFGAVFQKRIYQAEYVIDITMQDSWLSKLPYLTLTYKSF